MQPSAKELRKRRTHSPECKARVAMEAISGRRTIQEIAADQAAGLHKPAHRPARPIPVSEWKRQLLEGAIELFAKGQTTKDNGERKTEETERLQQIGRSAHGAGVAQKSLVCHDVCELGRLVAHDHPELSASRRCALLGLPRSTAYDRPTTVRESTLLIMARIDAVDLGDPCSGSRRVVRSLAREGSPISHDRVRNLMRRLEFTGH